VLGNDNNHKFIVVEETVMPNQLKFDLESITMWRSFILSGKKIHTTGNIFNPSNAPNFNLILSVVITYALL
jgi:hypothetical protein